MKKILSNLIQVFKSVLTCYPKLAAVSEAAANEGRSPRLLAARLGSSEPTCSRRLSYGLLILGLMISVASGQDWNSIKLDIKPMGWYPSNEFDTIGVEILIKDTVWEFVKQKQRWAIIIQGYAVRERYDYSGDPMPPGNYDSYFRTKKYLNLEKQEIEDRLIWMSKERGKATQENVR